jgi:hypothetical protein
MTNSSNKIMQVYSQPQSATLSQLERAHHAATIAVRWAACRSVPSQFKHAAATGSSSSSLVVVTHHESRVTTHDSSQAKFKM